MNYMKNVLLIGTTGYLGPKLTKQLLNDGVNVYTINRREPELKATKDFVMRDFTNEKALIEDILTSYSITTLVNLAWVGSYGKARFDKDIQMSNYTTATFLVDLLKNKDIHFINFGTISERIRNEKGEVVSEYGAAKREVTKMLCRAYKTDYKNLAQVTLGNVFGGEDKTNRFVSMILSRLMKNEDISVFSDGEQNFYPVFVNDFSSALSRIIRHKKYGDIILSGEVISMKEFLDTAKSALKSTSEITYGTVHEDTPAPFLMDDLKPDFYLSEAIQLTAEKLKEQEDY